MNISKKVSKFQRHAIRTIFHKNKFAHIREHFKENNKLSIYQLNIFNNLSLDRVKNGKAPNIFHSKFLERIITQSVSLEIAILYLPLY